jgi:hypothetical protein
VTAVSLETVEAGKVEPDVTCEGPKVFEMAGVAVKKGV